MKRQRKKKSYRGVLFSFITIGLGSVLGLALFSVVLEIVVTMTHSDKNTIYEIVPGINSRYVFRVKPNTTPTISNIVMKFNNFSMRRSTDITEAGQPGVYRILSYGDSIGLGVLVEEKDHYTTILERLLNANPKGKKYEVLNTARGNSPSIYSAHLSRDFQKHKPNMVLLEIELANDVADEALVIADVPDENGLLTKISGHRYAVSYFDDQYMVTLPLTGLFFEPTKAYNDLIRKVGNYLSHKYPNPVFSDSSNYYYYNLGFDQFYLTQKRLDTAFEKTFSVIKSIQSFAEKHGASFLLLIVPPRYTFTPNQYQSGSKELVARAISKATSLNIPYVDVTPSFVEANGFSLYFDFCHPTPQGYEIIANDLFQKLKSN
ncbi:MAG: hypothetical protein A3K03_05060 [Bdellovibrionales bacterium RIFOXYD1_FULL_44_7]|nr:MAG: hypothetical protein A3K03_05060 [Bdellovibrionales bacterium RIFOXYD1_FULL_44_7]